MNRTQRLDRLRDLAAEVGRTLPWAGPDSNVVAEVGASDAEVARLREAGAPADLIALLAACAHITLADVDNGYFVHDTATLSRDLSSGAPRRVDRGWTVFPFGSDGGGGRWVLRLDDPTGVYHLPEGAVHAGEYTVGPGEPTRVADDLDGFIDFLILAVERNVSGGPAHAG